VPGRAADSLRKIAIAKDDGSDVLVGCECFCSTELIFAVQRIRSFDNLESWQAVELTKCFAQPKSSPSGIMDIDFAKQFRAL
jgi:hypothetical protein